jgi:hypothetical protein
VFVDRRRVQKGTTEYGEITMEEHYVGRFTEAHTAVDIANAIIAAVLVNPGLVEPGPPGQAQHHNATIRVLHDPTNELLGEQTIDYAVQRFPESIAEQGPQQGEQNIFFLERKPDNSLEAIKILPATNENLERFVGTS